MGYEKLNPLFFLEDDDAPVEEEKGTEEGSDPEASPESDDLEKLDPDSDEDYDVGE